MHINVFLKNWNSLSAMEGVETSSKQGDATMAEEKDRKVRTRARTNTGEQAWPPRGASGISSNAPKLLDEDFFNSKAAKATSTQ